MPPSSPPAPSRVPSKTLRSPTSGDSASRRTSLAVPAAATTAAGDNGAGKRHSVLAAGELPVSRTHRRQVRTRVRRNHKGGVLVRASEISEAMRLLDPKGKGFITLEDLRAGLALFYDRISDEELRLMMRGKSRITATDLEDLLSDNELTQFDPVQEAMAVLDPLSVGSVDEAALHTLLKSVVPHSLSREDVRALVHYYDHDHDGRIGIHDFRSVLG